MAKLSPYASARETRAVLERYGLATKHSLGQNFLVNDGILQKIIHLANLEGGDDVLEIGPGIGTLTVALLQNARSVVSIEFDSDLPLVLAETTAPWANRFALIEKDALDVQEVDVRQALVSVRAKGGGVHAEDGRAFPNKLVANLPYAAAATVVLDYFQRFGQLESMTVMVQKEVADRMIAVPGTKDYGAFTVKLSLFAQPEGRFPVGPSNFFPPPRVESAVIRLNRCAPSDDEGVALGPEEVAAACLMAEAAFATRRKTLANSCKTYFSNRGPQAKNLVSRLPMLFEAAGIDSRRRGETLTRGEFIILGREYLALIRQ